jgi:hypothetical protein
MIKRSVLHNITLHYTTYRRDRCQTHTYLHIHINTQMPRVEPTWLLKTIHANLPGKTSVAKVHTQLPWLHVTYFHTYCLGARRPYCGCFFMINWNKKTSHGVVHATELDRSYACVVWGCATIAASKSDLFRRQCARTMKPWRISVRWNRMLTNVGRTRIVCR